ncbi:MAG: efflux RND transporter periplasmic adaptor subunit [Deltaproteobacteria bacterium]|nr:efflux RND transporter periplasmic adaptor subunit [Deltaproteobacteria bacterium]
MTAIMPKPNRTLALFVVSILAALLLAPHFAGARNDSKKKGRPPAAVRVSPVQEKEVVTLVTLIGSAEPWLETVVASEESGLVKEVLVEEGDRVQKGQVLCKQNTSQLELKVEAAKANMAEARVQETQAQRELQRQERLYSIKSVSEKAYDDARFASEASHKKMARLKVELRALEDQLDKKIIRAPVSGYVVKRHCLPGQWLGEGKPVVTLVVPDPILFMVPVPERHIPAMRKGDSARVIFDALPGRVFRGIIDAVIPRADKVARTFPVRIKILNRDNAIKAGMLGRATFPVGNPHRAILVPKDALVLSSSGTVVYVINDDKAHLVPVKIGPAHGPLIEIQGNLKAGSKVVVRGNERLRPGQPVRVMREGKSVNPPATHRATPKPNPS